MTSFGVQTFTIRREQKKDLLAAYLPLIRLGVRKFEVARIDFSEQNAKVLKSLVDEYGIEIVSVQVKPKYVFGAFDRIVAFCHTVGCPSVVISMLPFRCILGAEAHFDRFVATLDDWTERYAKEGIALAYHHHNWEYVKLASGERRMDALLSRTKKLRFVHDTYWTARSGVSPAEQIRRFRGRLLGIHLRDLTLRKRGLRVLCSDAAIGDGVIDFSAVLSAARSVGCRYTVIEQNTNVPYAELEKSLRALSAVAARLETQEDKTDETQ